MAEILDVGRPCSIADEVVVREDYNGSGVRVPEVNWQRLGGFRCHNISVYDAESSTSCDILVQLSAKMLSKDFGDGQAVGKSRVPYDVYH
jgi:hypothetical protein